MVEKRELICPKCGTEFDDNGKEYPSGVLCSACSGPTVGVIHPRKRQLTRAELEARIKELEALVADLRQNQRVFVQGPAMPSYMDADMSDRLKTLREQYDAEEKEKEQK